MAEVECRRLSQMLQLVQIVVVVSLALLLGTSDATLVRAIAALRGEATCAKSGEACKKYSDCCNGPCVLTAGWLYDRLECRNWGESTW